MVLSTTVIWFMPPAMKPGAASASSLRMSGSKRGGRKERRMRDLAADIAHRMIRATREDHPERDPQGASFFHGPMLPLRIPLLLN